MAGSIYSTVFGGNVVAPAIPTFLSLQLTTNVVLGWPLESNIISPAAAEIIEVSAVIPGATIQLSDARQVSNGYCALFNNIGANTFSVLDAQGNVLMAPASGQAWQLYLADNSTLQGTWRVFQYGAGVSNANAATLAGAGLSALVNALQQNYVTNVQNSNYQSTVVDRAKIIEWEGGAGTITLPLNANITAGWFCAIKNLGTGIVAVTPSSGLIDGQASLNFSLDNSAFVIYDGANFYTLGFGQQINSIFNFLIISLTGLSSPLVLSGVQLNRVAYRFTGALTANFVVQVPTTVQQYWVDNETTGAFTLTINAGGTGVTVPDGTRSILFCDGANVLSAVTQQPFAGGAVGAPSINFGASGDPQTGLYGVSAGIVGVSSTGVEVAQFSSLGIETIAGSAANPSYAFLPDTTTGWYRVGAGLIGGSSAGVEIIQIGANGVELISGTAAAPSVTFLADATSGLYLPSAGNLGLTVSGNVRMNVAANGNIMFTPGTAVVPISVVNGGSTPVGAFAFGTNYTQTGAATATLSANKPGANNGVVAWLGVFYGPSNLAGWMPIFGV